jgi:hypothetical protein
MYELSCFMYPLIPFIFFNPPLFKARGQFYPICSSQTPLVYAFLGSILFLMK